MDNEIGIFEARKIMASNFIGPDELSLFTLQPFDLSGAECIIPFSQEELLAKKDHYLLIYGASKFEDGTSVNIQNIKKIVSNCNDDRMPVFYNQDWYEKEEFTRLQMKEGWFLIRKDVYENSRSVNPEELLKHYMFPSAIKCVYSFFVAWICNNMKLWYEDFIWCNDVDHNGDRIYVGKYHDIDGINNDGFSIHRHLALRKCYSCID